MKIIKLKAENIQRIKAVEIEPNGSLVVVGGRNGQGKTSTLDSIWMALAGKRGASVKPVRDGAPNGTIELELDDDFRIVRSFKPDGSSTLKVLSLDGKRSYSSPQALLDSFGARFTFDPMQFKRLSPAEQAKVLRDVVGLDTSALEAQAAKLYEDRRAIGRELKQEQAVLADMAPLDAEVPDDEVASAEVLAQIQAALDENGAHDKLTRARDESARKLSALTDQLDQLQAAILAEKQQLAMCSAKLELSHSVDVGPLREQLDGIEDTNRRVRANAARAAQERRVAELAKQHEQLDSELDKARAGIDRALREARFPLPGLSFDGDGVSFNGIPFAQISGAEQLRVSVAMGLALNPKLRVLLIRDGSLLDDENLKLIADMAAEADAQVWLERVSAGEEVSVVIEDGEVQA